MITTLPQHRGGPTTGLGELASNLSGGELLALVGLAYALIVGGIIVLLYRADARDEALDEEAGDAGGVRRLDEHRRTRAEPGRHEPPRAA